MSKLWKSGIGVLFIFAFALSLSPIREAAAQGDVFAYPKGGQSQDQLARDQFDCNQWATQQSGFNPNQAQPQVYVERGYMPPPPSSSGGGEVVRGALGGALLGTGIGAIAGGKKGARRGAAIGALSGTMVGAVRRNRRKEEEARWHQQHQMQQQQQQRQVNNQYAQGRQRYNRAYSVCMEAKNYDVR